ncbi:MauE/DoxX family redox-associated membrane protein [Pedobacter miscanthi]|uniref:Methylamine utilisation protein MauE domain-containing protein n=1 Tax=Pedobacter miscanthi TaxID=2259170 RepID=A0A366L618_9SPHI|nr:MauE/DoxX family redox-associated membrane protein [Pedobacter miscanthi]RBQ08913.1 hypothetical protein DRW42_06805 [Pedobacter miscanthi]
MKISKNSTLILSLVSGILILLWVYTSLSKLSEIEDFKRQLNNQVFSRKFTPVLLWAIPGIEITAAAMLLFKKTLRAGLILSAILMALFTGYIVLVSMNIFNRVPCSCGGVLKNMGWNSHLIFNTVFLAISLFGVYKSKKGYPDNDMINGKA